ncbi:50S ribosomal protein L25/general stress protein Ctc [Flaviflagellibacter deserti]|jgi:large subunit ribosomal protein L25|uniref:Large ribosomal subunit protein bL25 n=1 Tax=Flaviflagellibacter deserti TaxID=2267266 RepID=A0ABV9YX20_9HYPH
MSATKVIKAEARDRAGKGAARALRRENKIPAVIYGAKQPPVGITLDAKQTTLLLHAGGFLTTIFEIEVGGKKERAIPRDYQVDPVKDFLIHVDFLRVSKDSVVHVQVPVHFVNEDKSPGLKAGGVLNIVEHSIDLTVPAEKIPEFIEIDLTGLTIGDSIHISAVKLPEGTKPTSREDFTVATIAAPTVAIEEPAAAEGEAAPAAEEPKKAE